MWLSKRIVQQTPEIEPATLGTVTIGGADGAVVTDAEKRSAKVIAPGGYAWQPAADDSVLVVRGNELYVTGKLAEAGGMKPGEVKNCTQHRYHDKGEHHKHQNYDDYIKQGQNDIVYIQ